MAQQYSEGIDMRFDFVKKPSFCFIAPQQYLSYTTASDTHLVLAHMIGKPGFEQYTSFYQQRAAAGDFVILDNGAFEIGESYDPEKLIDLALEVGARSLVLPDYPGQPSSKTIKAAETWIPKFDQAGLIPFFVPQSEVGDFEGWLQAYKWGCSNSEVGIVGMSILGIPNCLPTIPRRLARVVMVEYLKRTGQWYENKHHHFLGLNAPDEIEALSQMDVITTIDSSSPIWYAINGHWYDTNREGWGVPKKHFIRHVNFQEPMYGSTVADTILHNIDVVGDFF